MAVNGISHVNIRTSDIAASVRFYVDAFDFEYRRGPAVMNNQAHWLYDKSGQAIIHFRIMKSESDSTGPIDHVALDCDGQAEILERLKARDIDYKVANVQPGVTQVFLKDPHGVMLELNFKQE